MFLVLARKHAKVRSEFRVERIGGVTYHWETAAARRTILCKRGYEYMTARPNGSANLLDVDLAVFRICQEMEHRAIVPDRVRSPVEGNAQNVRR